MARLGGGIVERFFSWSVVILSQSCAVNAITALYAEEDTALVLWTVVQVASLIMCVAMAVTDGIFNNKKRTPYESESAVPIGFSMVCGLVLNITMWSALDALIVAINATMLGVLGCVFAVATALDNGKVHPIWAVTVCLIIIGVVGTSAMVTLTTSAALGVSMAIGALVCVLGIERHTMAPPRPCIGGLPDDEACADTGRAS